MSESPHLVFARKYRPQLFKDVIHQEVAINALSNALKHNRVGHAYIFFGPRGVGKTTIARILAKRLNCENPNDIEPCNECISCQEILKGISSDVLEIDAASNRKIDDVRNLRESVKFTPMRGSYRVYIIDEFHMLTTEAFNALLKTLEEPPRHVIFILATTEFHKIPETILSRCQDFTFKKVPHSRLQSYIEELCKIEKLKYDSEGLFWIAKKGDGSVRDTLSFLEQAVTFTDGNLTGELVGRMIGYKGVDTPIAFINNLLSDSHSHESIKMLEQMFQDGADLNKFLWDIVEFTHSAILIKENLAERENLNFPIEDIQKVKNAFSTYSNELLNLLAERVFAVYEKLNSLRLRNSYEAKVFLEIQFRKIISDLNKPSVAGLLEKIRKLSELVQKDSEIYNANINSIPVAKTESSAAQQKEVLEDKNAKMLDDVEAVLKDKFAGVEVDASRVPEL